MDNIDIDDLETDPEDKTRDEALAKAFIGHAPAGLRPMNAATADALSRTGNGLLKGTAGMFDVAAFILLHSKDESEYRDTLASTFNLPEFRDRVTRLLESSHPADLTGRAEEIRKIMLDYVSLLSVRTGPSKKKRKAVG
jgi:hypothetical protein